MKTKINNFVAKHAPRSGAGAHDFKKGHKKAKRAKRKQQFRKLLKEIL